MQPSLIDMVKQLNLVKHAVSLALFRLGRSYRFSLSNLNFVFGCKTKLKYQYNLSETTCLSKGNKIIKLLLSSILNSFNNWIACISKTTVQKEEYNLIRCLELVIKQRETTIRLSVPKRINQNLMKSSKNKTLHSQDKVDPLRIVRQKLYKLKVDEITLMNRNFQPKQDHNPLRGG